VCVVLCFFGVCCLFQIGAGLSRVSMLPLVNAWISRRGAPTVFKCVWHVLDATLDIPGTAIAIRLPESQACTVASRVGALCVGYFMLYAVCCVFQISAVLSSASTATEILSRLQGIVNPRVCDSDCIVI
jgi:hypothetical protein